jgi:hypothetical protein
MQKQIETKQQPQILLEQLSEALNPSGPAEWSPKSFWTSWVKPFFAGSVSFIVLVFCIVFFNFVYPVLCLVSNVATVSGLSNLDCLFGFLERLFQSIRKYTNSEKERI